MNKNNIIIFTDLDGSLLDHNNYSFQQAVPLLQKLKQNDIPLIINSSKTELEIIKLHEQLQLDTPCIIENGAAVIFSAAAADKYLSINTNKLMRIEDNYIKTFASKRSFIIKTANQLKQKYHFKYTGFDDLTLQQLSDLTLLNLEDAYAAKQRSFSEPVVWQDDQQQLKIFKKKLASHNIETQAGGRFIHLGSHCSKGQAMQWLLNHWKFTPNVNKIVIAIGDSMNDISMLNEADYALVVKNNAEKLVVEGKKKTIYSIENGTAGWIEMLEPLINARLEKLVSIHK